MSQLNWTLFSELSVLLKGKCSHGLIPGTFFGIPGRVIDTQGDPFRLNFYYYLSYNSVLFMKRVEQQMLCSVTYSSTIRAGKLKKLSKCFFLYLCFCGFKVTSFRSFWNVWIRTWFRECVSKGNGWALSSCLLEQLKLNLLEVSENLYSD